MKEEKKQSKKQLAHDLGREKKIEELKQQHAARKKLLAEFDLNLVDSEEEWVEKKLAEGDRARPRNYPGNYQDAKQIASIYQQKFVEHIQQLCPHVIEELREFVPYFERLMGNERNKFTEIFNKYKMEFFELDSSLDQEISHSIIDKYFLKFRPDNYQNRRDDYKWGEFRLLLHIFYFMFVHEENNEKSDEMWQDTIELLKESLAIDTNDNNILEEIGESVIQDYLFKRSDKIIKEILWNVEHSDFREEATKKVIKFLEGIASDPETGIADFIKLQVELLKWAERHNLQKDWLMRYGYEFLYQFSNNPDIKISDIEISLLSARSFETYPFVFKFDGWDPVDPAKDYKKRVTESFKAELQRYFHDVGNYSNLKKMKKLTNPLDYDLVKPLVRKTVQKWSEERIVENDFGILDNLQDKRKFDRKVKYLKEQLPTFEEFDLPYRD